MVVVFSLPFTDVESIGLVSRGTRETIFIVDRTFISETF